MATKKDTPPNPVGRPTEYGPEILKHARDYLDKVPAGKVPQIAGLARHLKLARSTVYLWAEKPGCEEFSDIVGDILAEQELRLIDNGLDGTYNPTITKLLLHKHGHHDKLETELTGNVSIIASKLDEDI